MVTDLFRRLTALLGDRCTDNQTIREQHGHDESWHAPLLPDAVCFPESTDEVAKIVTLCASEGVPVVPYGAGTSLEGHVQAVRGGISIDLSRLDRIVAIRPQDLDVTVQAGVTRQALNRRLADHGLFFPVDPGAEATLGGMAATRASGTNAVRYGTMRENVVSATVVLADGQVLRTARRARKSSAGYDLTRLFVGSEGTLGVFTELTLRVYGLPEAMAVAVVSFGDLRAACETAIEVVQLGIPVARMELLDEVHMEALNRWAGLGYKVQPTLLFELHGSDKGVAEQAAEVAEIATEHGGEGFTWARDAAERERLWQARHQAYYAAKAMRPGCAGWTTDVCVPISRLADCILETKEDLAASSLLAPLVGHVGDGNFHLVLLIDPASPNELAEAERLNSRLVERALSMDGTCTGEHGVGLGKRRFLLAEHGPGVEVMRAIKKALDPQGILNPGKILPDAEEGS